MYQFTRIGYPNGLNVYKTYNHSKKLKMLRAESDPAGLITKLEYSYVSNDSANKDRDNEGKVLGQKNAAGSSVAPKRYYVKDHLDRSSPRRTTRETSRSATRTIRTAR